MAKEQAGRKRRARAPGDVARMHDVAEAAGVSLMTVSRALREPQRLSKATLARVMEAVQRLGYVPNHMASNLASSRSSVVGQIVPSINNSFYSETVDGTSEVLRAEGLALLIGNSGYSLQDEEALIGAFLAQRVCGLILHNTEHSPGALQMLQRARVPVVETGDLPEAPIDMAVSYSNFEAARAMTLHLAERGYRHIGLVSLDTSINRRAAERQRGYLVALQSLGLHPDPLLMREVAMGLDSGAQAMVDIVTRQPEVDAIFFSGDVLAVGALFEAQRRGWAVPGRLAIAAFDDLSIMQHTVPSLTSMRLPRREIGRRSAQALLQRMRGNTEPVRVDLGFEVSPREST